MSVEIDHRCFCCGNENPDGLKLDITYPAEGVAETATVIPERFTGWRRITHGGYLSMLLDELMAHAVISAGSHAFTAEMTVRFRSAVEVGTKIRVEARVDSCTGRLYTVTGRIQTENGTDVARSTGKFLAQASV